MKQLTYIITFIGGALLLQACNKDLLDTVPNDRISTEIFWKTDNDATLAANAVYTYMAEGAEHFIGLEIQGWASQARITAVEQRCTVEVQPVDSPLQQGPDDRFGWRVAGQFVQIALNDGRGLFFGHGQSPATKR